MSRIVLRGLSKSYSAATVVEPFDLEIEQGELVIFLGPSGCGKTTTLRMIAGFVTPSSGTIRVGERDITQTPTFDRNIGVVFQNYALFPHLNVFENVAFGLRRRKMKDAEIRPKVEKALEMVAMGHLAARMPRELSGGQQQRVAIARAIVIEPDVLLLDEPLSNLDAKLRLSIRQEIRRLQKSLGITTILVTHDQEEAMSIADRLVVMSHGKVQQVGAPETVYARPANSFVADFIGGANFLSGSVVAGQFVSEHGLRLGAALPESCSRVVVRPEQIKLSAGPADKMNTVPVKVTGQTFLGSGRMIEVRHDGGDTFNVYIGAGETAAVPPDGEQIVVEIPAAHIMPIEVAA